MWACISRDQNTVSVNLPTYGSPPQCQNAIYAPVNGGLVAAVAAATAAADFHHFFIENQNNSFFLLNLLQ